MINHTWLKEMCINAGADEVGIVELGRSNLALQKPELLKAFSKAKTLICYACTYNHVSTRSYYRSISNHEYHNAESTISKVGYEIVRQLRSNKIDAVSMVSDFPMESDGVSPKHWIIEHKPIAVEAGIGMMGLNRQVLHPVHGAYILLNTILIDSEVSQYDHPVETNPCIGCNLCVSICPTGSIHKDGSFNFMGCFRHNYRDKQNGFIDMIKTASECKNLRAFEKYFNNSDIESVWQNLQSGSNFRCSYCVAVCPAGKERLEEYKQDKKGYFNEIFGTLKSKEETVFVTKGSDAESAVITKFPNKKIKYVKSRIKYNTINGFLQSLQIGFQIDQSKDVDCIYHFEFTGNENRKSTVIIKNQRIQILPDFIDSPDLYIKADSEAWLKFLAKEMNIVQGILFRKIMIKGNMKHMLEFKNCFS